MTSSERNLLGRGEGGSEKLLFLIKKKLKLDRSKIFLIFEETAYLQK